MKIAVIGAGFTGLTAALRLVQAGHEVVVFESEKETGGLAKGFKQPDWQWPLEHHYHHLFTNDQAAKTLAKSLGQKLEVIRPVTDVLVNQEITTLDSPSSLLRFPYLPLPDRLRMGLALGYLRYLGHLSDLSSKKALPWLKEYMGKKATELIWEPLLEGKFGEFKNDISLTWFWARIKKRTSSLMYPEGGFQSFANNLAKEINKLGGKIYFNTTITKIIPNSNRILSLSMNHEPQTINQFDKVIVTAPSSIFCKVAKLPKAYSQKLSSIPHLNALNMILIMEKPFLQKTYWLNITDNSFPFLALVEHTNFIDPKYYGGKHLLYIGNYLPDNHPYLKLTPNQLLKVYSSFLKKINPNYQLPTTNYQLFTSPNAQPVVTPDYPKLMPDFKTPLPNVYLANMDMIYPWDRGVNYAIELGEKIADTVTKPHE